MKAGKNRKLWVAVGLLAAFVVWTVLVKTVDVQPIGPRGAAVGFATLNGWFHARTGVHWSLYVITDWLGLVPIGVAFGFAVLGLVQWMGRRCFWRVDRSILLLGVFYTVVIAVYVLFELVVINRRPVLIDGYLEASYPSSTTMLVLCVLPTAMTQLQTCIKNKLLRRVVCTMIGAFMAFMVAGRLLSGVHWFSDIVGGALLSAGLVMMYKWGLSWLDRNSR